MSVVAKLEQPRGVAPLIPLLDQRRYVPLSSVQSLYECRAEVIITHAPSTSDACETHAQPVEKSIASLVLSALLTRLTYALMKRVGIRQL